MSNFSRYLRDAGIKVGPVILLQLGSSFQIELSGKGGRSNVEHAVYCCFRPCCHIERPCNCQRIHTSRIL